MAPASSDVVAARDKAILQALKIRSWTKEGLLTVLPIEPGQTPSQREAALSSALIRLGVKKLANVHEGQWTLA